MPKVSVVMPVYNTEKYVGEAIESILNQTFKDFEFIIIDDGSTDNSYDICKKYAEKDKRIKLLQNNGNKGISYTRNKLHGLINTDYVAPMDSDDISYLNRLELEYNFLNKNKDYGVVSGHNKIIDENGNITGERKYSNDIDNIILKKSPLSQPTCMFRCSIFEELGGYDKELNYAEDYDLWLRMYSKGYKIKNLDEVLLKYRVSKNQSKSNRLKATLKNTIFVQQRAIKKYGLKPSFSDMVYHKMERILLLIPSKRILFLFKIIEYRK